jgi:hypothetical protein
LPVYERAGFREVGRYSHFTDGGLREFVWMTRGPLTPPPTVTGAEHSK